jgi:hypothetical protein
VRILLDENLPEALVAPLRGLGHVVDSVGSLKLKGLDNGRLYREIASQYDLFFTKDREFATQVSDFAERTSVKVVLTVIRQQPAPGFIAAFVDAFSETDWAATPLVGEWPAGR